MGKAHVAKGHGGDDGGWAFVDGEWMAGNPAILGPRHHAVWLSSVVFDGARSFDGFAPDLDRHCARVIRSAEILGLAPALAADEIEALAREGIAKFDKSSPLYICPMFYAEEGFITPEPDSTKFVISVYESALPEPTGFSATLANFRRPAKDMAPTEAKAACLYPNVARCVREADGKGFDTAVVLDPDNNVAEFAYANLFLAKDGVVHTPAHNGTFLNGITRQRVITLLQDDGVPVEERPITYDDVLEADELFGSGNYYKVAPCTQVEDRHLQAGPLFRKARELYFDFARSSAA
jgi:branched-chain amino acid aminotransferase